MTATNTDEHPAAARYYQNVERVEADLIAVVRSHHGKVPNRLIAVATIEFAGDLLAALVKDEPHTAPQIDAQLAHLRLFVATAGQPPQ